MKKELFENQLYESPSVEIVEVISNSVLAGSSSVQGDFIDPWEDGNSEWFN